MSYNDDRLISMTEDEWQQWLDEPLSFDGLGDLDRQMAQIARVEKARAERE